MQVKTMCLFGEETDLSALSQTLLKTTVREKLMQKFVAKLGKHLDEQAEEHREISELAEKLAQIA